MSQYKNIVTDFKDLRKVIGEITKKTPAKSRYQQQAERMGSKEASVPFVKQKGKATSRYSAKVSGGQEKVAGPKEIKKAYIKIGRSAQGPMKKQMAIVAKELEKMGYKTYDPIAMKKMFEAIAEKMNYKEAKQTPWEFMQDVVKKKSAMKYGSVTVDMFTASAIVNAYKKVNNANKKKIEKGTINQLISLSQKVMGLSSDKKWEEPLKGFPYNEVAKALQTEAYSKNSKSGTEVAKMMMKSKTMKDFAAKVKKMKTVTADQLDKMLPDYISGGDIGAMFEEVLDEGKMGDLFLDIQQGATAKDIAKDYPVSLAQAKEFLKDYYGQKKGSRKEASEGKMDGSKLTGQEISSYFKRNKVADKTTRKAIEIALDHGGALNFAMKEIEKLKRGLTKNKDVKKALNYANYGEAYRVESVGFQFKEDSPIAGDIKDVAISEDPYTPQKKGVNKNIANYWKKLGFKKDSELEKIQSMYTITDHNGVVAMYKAGKREFEKSVR